MNYITWNKAVSLYPYATFEQRRTLVLNRNVTFRAAKAKYIARGFAFQRTFTPDEARRPGPFQAGPRYVGDNKSWVLALETDSLSLPVPASSVPACDPAVVHSWDLTNLWYSDTLHDTPPANIVSGMIGQSGDHHTPLAYFSVLQHHRLRHKYVVHREFYRIAMEVSLDQNDKDQPERVHSHSYVSPTKLPDPIVCSPHISSHLNLGPTPTPS
jgi:hypothetical protein